MSGISGVAGGDQMISLDDAAALQPELAPNEHAYVVERGDNMWTLAKDNGYVDENGNVDLQAFLQQNPHLDPSTGGRDPSLIYPGEVIIINGPENGTVETIDENGESAYQTFQDGEAVGHPVGTGENSAGGEVSVNENGQLINADGEPVTGWVLASDSAENDTLVWYEDGQPTASQQVVSDNGIVISVTNENGETIDGLDTQGNGWVTVEDTAEADTQVWYENGRPTASQQVIADNGHVISTTDENGDAIDGLDAQGNGWVTVEDTAEADTLAWYENGRPTGVEQVVSDAGHSLGVTDANGDPVELDENNQPILE